ERLEIHDQLPPRVAPEAQNLVGVSPAMSPRPNGFRPPEDSELVNGTPWWPIERQKASGLRPSAGWSLYALTGVLVNVIGFSVAGMNIAQIEASVEMVTTTQRQNRNFIPLFLTDQSDLEPFRLRGFAVEYLSRTLPPDVSVAQWDTYRRKRLDF